MGVASLSIFFSKAVERDRKTQKEFLAVELRFKHLTISHTLCSPCTLYSKQFSSYILNIS